jgi:hypothetical protein
VIWVNRNKETLDSSQKKPTAEVKSLLGGGEAARRRLAMKAVGLHPDVIVVTSRFWPDDLHARALGEEAFCIDSPVLPDELELLPAIAEQADFRVVGCLATHVDWDHRARPLRLRRRPLGVGGVRAPARLRNEPARRSASCATSTRSTTSSVRAR